VQEEYDQEKHAQEKVEEQQVPAVAAQDDL
jgi:hypothetical protein